MYCNEANKTNGSKIAQYEEPVPASIPIKELVSETHSVFCHYSKTILTLYRLRWARFPFKNAVRVGVDLYGLHLDT